MCGVNDMIISKAKIEAFQAKALMSSKELAEASNMCSQMLSTVKVRGTCRPKTAEKIASALGVDVKDILEEE